MQQKRNIRTFDNVDTSSRSRTALVNVKKNSPGKVTSKSPQKGIDHTYISNLQGEVTRTNNKYADLNHKYNLVENKLKIVYFS